MRIARILLGLVTAASAQAQAPDSVRCASARVQQRRTIDSTLAVRPSDWRPDPSDDSLKVAVREAHVVVQVRVDTLGRPEMHTFRPVRWRELRFVEVTRRQLPDVTLDPYEILPGCKVPYLLTLPIRFSTDVRD